ncbi:MAG TPA: lamin tail domain-containing protein [Verrucomicrobiae bacterium]
MLLFIALLAPVAVRGQSTFIIEAEDFNHGGGQHVAAASTMPYLGGAYNNLGAVVNVDYFEPADDGSSPEYRMGENPNVPMTQNPDMNRGTWSVTTNYRIGWIAAGDWYNYTRTFPAGQYKVSAALSHESTAEGMLAGALQRVTAGATTTSQTVQQLGVFSAAGSGGWGANNLVPLVDGLGNQVVLNLSGLTTLRFTAQSGDYDYLRFDPLLPPSIAQHPQNRSVVEGQEASFTVVNSNSDPVTYQWQSNLVNIAGANSATYTISAVPLGANNSRYRCLLSNSLGTATSSEATLTVTADTQRPTIARVLNLGANTIQVTFSEAVSTATATTTGNYGVSGGIGVTGAVMGGDTRTVLLTVSTLTFGSAYTVTVNNVRDTSVAQNVILTNSQMTFTALAYAPTTIGGGTGDVVAAGGGFNVTSGGGQIGGNADQFQFAYERRTNNFDVRVRVARLGITDAFVQAGLMAREDLNTGSRFAGIFGSSAQLGAFFESRGTASGNSATVAPNGGYPVNYPYMWLRLQRSGNLFTGFASFDGEAWTQLGSSTIAMPSVVYFGMVVGNGHSGAASTTAEFRDLGPAIGGTVVALNNPRERLGPSSRRTGLSISEIMFHPKERVDTNDVEFVEIYNGSSIFEDLSGFKLVGGIEYTFPNGTILPAGAFLVVAKSPGSMQNVYGLSGVLGPWSGSLNNAGDVVELRDELGRILVTAEYSDGASWPAAADGAGHSLVLARPSYGAGDVRAWAASTYVGGSPGDVDAVSPVPEQNVVINEFLAHTDDPQPDYIELYNHSNVAVDISGCWLSDSRDLAIFQIPSPTIIPARGFVAFDQNALGFSLNAAGETIYFLNTNRTRVLDALKFGGQENGVSSGRWPDGAASIRRLSTVTQGAANSKWRANEVVVNEIMYSPISGDDDDEFVELHNTTGQAISLAGWKFTDGPDFTFPAGASIPANGYVVVAKNAARLRANYPQLNTANTFGDYGGTLRNSSEDVAIAKPDTVVDVDEFGQVTTNTIYITVSEVRYRDGGRWSAFADGGGSSLELIDPRSDTTQADNWRESDETAKGQWSTVEFTGVLDNGNGGYPPDQLQITLQGAGEALVDQVQVLRSGVEFITANGNFEAGATGWVFQGNHSGSTVDVGGAFEGTRALHIRAPGRGDTGMNRIRTALNAGLASGNTVTIRARVRWLKGWPEILLRLRGNWLECAGAMNVPTNLGTPGLVNSRLAANTPPAIYEVKHSPVLPNASQAVTVTTRVSDPDPVTSLVLRYRVDPSATVSAVTMRDDGLSGDSVANDGLFSAVIPGQASGALVAFRVEATDASGTRRFPSDAPTRECLVRWGESVPFGTFGNYRALMTEAILNAWNSVDSKDNTYRDMTFVYNADRTIYNATIKDKGSPFHAGGGDAFIVTPEDEPFLGGTDMAICSTGNAGDEPTAQREQLAFWIGRKMGAHYLNRRYVHFYFNGSPFNGRAIMEDSEEPNGDYSAAVVPDADEGDLYKIEDWFEFNDDASGFSSVDATLQRFTTTGGAYKLARYRWAWRKRAVSDSANNYTNLFDLVTAMNTAGSTYVQQVENLVNVRNWMAVFALQRIAGNWDSYGFNRGKNGYIYKGDGLRWEMFPWDIDFVLGAGSNGPTDALWDANDPVIDVMYANPTFQRYLWQAYMEAVNGPLTSAAYNAQMDERYRVLLANNVTVSGPAPIKSYVDARRGHIVNQVNGANTSTFAITSNGGNNFPTNGATATISGTAPFAVYGILVNGVLYPITWTSPRDWTVSIPLTAVNNTLTLVGVNKNGTVVPGMTDTISVTYTGVLYRPEDYLVINEIMYNAATPGGSFIEIYNRSLNASFDLSAYRLEGVGYTFTNGAVLAPNSYLVLVSDRAGFAAAYGAGIVVFDQYTGNLDNGGERLKLVKPGATPDQDLIIDEVRYDDDPPWPTLADGFGPSLQLIDAAQDNWAPANWGTTATNAINRATPRAANSIVSIIPAVPKLYFNEILPQNVSGTADRFGEREPWIELRNAGTTTLDLSAYYLSDNATNLTKWQFPAGTSLAPNQFLTVFADNEPGESISTELHTSFRLTASTGVVTLARMQGSSPLALDFIRYNALGADRAFGSYPDGQPQERRIFHFPTFNAPNDPTSIEIDVFINEWLAGNTRILADPADGDFDDWIELYNASTNAVDLSGYTMTDVLTNTTKYTIPNGKIIPAGGYLIVWADEEQAQNSFGADVHANFKLSGGGEAIGLFAPDGSLVDSLSFGAQTDDISEGRISDGAEPPFVTFTTPSPRAPNVFGGGNQAPVLGAIGNKSIAEGSLLTFTATATDPNAGQTLTYALGVGAPAGTAINPTSGAFTWTPTEAQGPGSFPVTVRVTDNGSPARVDAETITITVTEANSAPLLAAISNTTIDEGAPLNVTAAATDSDVPADTLSYTLDAGSPQGASIDPVSGVIAWIPSETQGVGDYNITVRVTDNGSPVLSHTRTFSVHVNEVNNPPVLQAILPQTIDEGQTLNVTAQAVDPDAPPSSVTYSLQGTVPPGASINPTSGLISWVTTESSGPSTNIFTIRATENNAAALSDTSTFSVVVREVNQAPIITAINDATVADGALVSIQVQARDNDVPSQTLTYQLEPGAPASASINSSGAFSWAVPVDQAAGTNTITVRVTDNGPGILSATATFRVIVQPQVRVVINEIMHSPSVANGEYVEIHNGSGTTTWNISGWRLVGKGGLSYTFAAGTTLAPGSFINVARNRTAFQSAYGAGVPVVGDWTGNLQAAGDTLSLIQPTAQGDVVIDKVTFSNAQPWPVAGGGTALQLVDARQDNNRVANWEAAAGYTGPTNLIVFTNQWRFNQSGTDLGTAWRNTNYADAAWPQGRGILYVEDAALPEPKNTLLTIGPVTYYFRGRFTLPLKPQGAQLSLRYLVDDGAVFYLNGQEIHRVGVPVGATNGTFADRTVTDAAYEGPITLPADALVAGENIIAVEVHQANAGSTDIVFGCELNLVGGSVPPRTPGAANSVVATLPTFDAVFVNEVLAVNSTSATDAAGEREPWVELHNSGSSAISLSGLYLTDTYANLTRWAFPAAATLGAGEYRVVFLDGEPGESIGTELHTSFRLGASGSIALVRMQNGEPAVVDYLNFGTGSANVSYGAIPNGQVDDRIFMTPTPATPNASAQPNQAPTIQTITAKTVAEGTQLQFNVVASDPDAGQTLSYSMQGAPSGATLSPAGVFTWTPTEAQAPATNTVSVIVTDNGSPARSATNTFQLTATEVNANPTAPTIAAQLVTEGALLSINLNATDADVPAQTLTYVLSNAPAGMVVSASGVITWTPTEAQGPGNYSVSVTAQDNWSPAGSVTITFSVAVSESNAAPVINAIADQTVNAGNLVSLNVTGTDADLPTQTLTFSLEPGAPTGAAITAGGAFTWTPTTAQANTTNSITVRVRDSHTPAGTSTRNFNVIVRPQSQAPQITASFSPQRQCVLNWNSQAGVRYRVLYQNVLAPSVAWQTLVDVDGTGSAINYTDATSGGSSTRFYKVEVLP